ncbi:hypothetical protein CN203_27640 [Sinorhizobium meliloti]|uniref:NHL repeat-containing protein n=1 Tax=Rhizobium meliloti TaxID=382 RepID=UPI000474EDB6|nr:NHL repeat-containing protein [Sinorhizobium meliloti]RVH72560.1 hypothetical protein CN203_27640 [Sinorhizobium meliloti]
MRAWHLFATLTLAYLCATTITFAWNLSVPSLNGDAWWSNVLVGTHESDGRVLFFSLPEADAIRQYHPTQKEEKLKLPLDAVIDESGVLWIADTGNNRIQRINLSTGDVISISSIRGAAFNRPSAVAIGKDGEILVADTDNHRIVKISRDGSDGLELLNAEQIKQRHIIGIAYDKKQDTIAMLSNWPPSLSIFSVSDGKFSKEFSQYGFMQGGFLIPSDLSFDGHGNIFVSDDQANRISKFNIISGEARTWGQLGAEPGEFYHPAGVGVVGERLYVLDYGNRRGAEFNLSGQFRRFFAVSRVNSDEIFPDIPFGK